MDSEHLKNIAEKARLEITEICRLGGFAQSSSFIPSYVSHSFNRILFFLGERFGWKNKAELHIESENIIKDIEIYVGYFLKSHESLVDFGIDPERIKLMSPVLVLDAFVAGNHSLYSSMAISNIYLFLSAAKLFEVLELLNYVSDEANSEFDRTNKLIEAQSHLLIAFEASNRAIEMEFEAKTISLEEYFSKDAVERLVELEKYKQKVVKTKAERKSGGQRPTYWKKHKCVIRKYISQYETFTGNKKDKCISLITEEVKLNTGANIIPEIKNGTFNKWLTNYRKYGKPFL